MTEFIDSGATGLFGQIVFHVTERMNLTLGYRSTEDEKGAGAVILNSPRVAAQFGTNPLVIAADPATNDATVFRTNSWTSDDYRFVVDYQWNDEIFTYLSWSTAYKAGGFADFINDDTGSGYVADGNMPRFGLIPYDPEYVEGYELGLRSEWLDRRLRLNGAIFDMRFTDRHIRSQDRYFQNPPFTANASQLDINGIEIDLTYAITDNLRLTSSVGTLDSMYSGIDPSATGGVFNETPRERMPDIGATDMAGHRVLPDGSIGGGGAGVGAHRWEVAPPRMIGVSFGYHLN